MTLFLRRGPCARSNAHVARRAPRISVSFCIFRVDHAHISRADLLYDSGILLTGTHPAFPSMRDVQANLLVKIQAWVKYTLFFIASGLFSLLFAYPVFAATMTVSPATGTFSNQSTFTVHVEVNTDQAINGAEGTLQFPLNKLEVVGIDKSQSIMSLWVQEPAFSANGSTGLIKFSAIKLNPGYTGSRGNVFNVTFHVKDVGVANVSFSSGDILANDGMGTNILDAFGGGIFSLTDGVIIPTVPAPSVGGSPVIGPSRPVMTSSAMPQMPFVKYWIQDDRGGDVLFSTSNEAPRWSNSPFAKLTWDLPPDVVSVASAFDDEPDTIPTERSTGLNTQLLPFVSEGTHYFHIAFVNGMGMGQVLHFPVLVDFRGPKSFTIDFDGEEISNGGIHSTSNPRPRLSFFTEDDLSGLDHYQFKLNSGDWSAVQLEPDGTFILPKLESQLRYELALRAFDLAGNSADATSVFVIEPVVAPSIAYCPKTYGSADGPLVVEGRSAPEARVEIVLDNGAPVLAYTKADENGSWRLVYSNALPEGLYTVRARQLLGNGAESVYSEAVTVRVNTFFGKTIEFVRGINWYVFLIIFIVVQVVTIWYYRRLFTRLRGKMHQRLESVTASANQGIAKIERRSRKGAPIEEIAEDLQQLQQQITQSTIKVKRRNSRLNP